jgi:hypothetical protein
MKNPHSHLLALLIFASTLHAHDDIIGGRTSGILAAQQAERHNHPARKLMNAFLPRPATSLTSLNTSGAGSQSPGAHHGLMKPLRVPAFHGVYGLEAAANLSNFRQGVAVGDCCQQCTASTGAATGRPAHSPSSPSPPGRHAHLDTSPRTPLGRSGLLAANAPLFAARGELEDWDKSYARFDMYQPNVACPPGRPIERFGAPSVRPAITPHACRLLRSSASPGSLACRQLLSPAPLPGRMLLPRRTRTVASCCAASPT